jgi:CRISPR-associated protein Cmr2
MPPNIYTAVTFAPVQGFIEKSRKLRDLYGSSYLLSFIAHAICKAAETQKCAIISPALPNITQGLPNQIIIQGQPGETVIKTALMESWKSIVKGCQKWIESSLPDTYTWNRDWNLWSEHTWEFFYVEGKENETISQVRQRLNEAKRQRAWTSINWQGESSTLSGADAVAYPDMANVLTTGNRSAIKEFYRSLHDKLGDVIDPEEELSIPELIKRMITHSDVISYLKKQYDSPSLDPLKVTIDRDLNPNSFKELSRKDNNEWTGWFMGDGDGASDYLKWVGKRSSELEDDSEGELTTKFSKEMRDWGKEFKANEDDQVLSHGRVIYAGGDDFLGVMYRTDEKLEPQVCLEWLSKFKSAVWNGLGTTNPDEKITASVGFVWASPQVPQRDVLQHTRLAEGSAKRGGKDRVAIRILFAGGNHLEWVCPWRILEDGLFKQYRDRHGVTNALEKASWTHFYNDVAVLESRHAFGATLNESTTVAIALMQVYFPDWPNLLSEMNLWNIKNEYKVTHAGILGNKSDYPPKGQKNINTEINQWVINLAKVGFYLCSDT